MNIPILIIGDAIESLASIDTGSVDMILADHPYGTTQNEWDIMLD